MSSLLHVYAPPWCNTSFPFLRLLPSAENEQRMSRSRRKKVECLQFDNGSLRGSLIIHASLNVFCCYFASSFEGDEEDGGPHGHQFLSLTPTFRPQSSSVDSAQSKDLFEGTCGLFGGNAKWADDKWSISNTPVQRQHIYS